jgi:hypothetical protein
MCRLKSFGKRTRRGAVTEDLSVVARHSSHWIPLAQNANTLLCETKEMLRRDKENRVINVPARPLPPFEQTELANPAFWPF